MTTLKDIAEQMISQNCNTVNFYQHGFIFRKGKSIVDIRIAVHNAMLKPPMKTEYHISALEGYLQRILKKDKAVKEST